MEEGEWIEWLVGELRCTGDWISIVGGRPSNCSSNWLGTVYRVSLRFIVLFSEFRLVTGGGGVTPGMRDLLFLMVKGLNQDLGGSFCESEVSVSGDPVLARRDKRGLRKERGRDPFLLFPFLFFFSLSLSEGE